MDVQHGRVLIEKQLLQILSTVDASKESRNAAAGQMLNNLQLIPGLMQHLCSDDEFSDRAWRVLEIVASKNLTVIAPHLSVIVGNMETLAHDSSIRAAAKISNLIAKARFASGEIADRIIESCFKWLIDDEKVAAKAFAARALHSLSGDYQWIAPELRAIIEKQAPTGSAGFKVVAREILKNPDL